MRFLIIPSPALNGAKTHAEEVFDEAVFTAYMNYNEEMHKAGVLVASEGLNPAATGAHVAITGGKRTVVDGPFAETKELIAGFWIWQVKSREEAIEWLKRAPFENTEVEIRQVYELEDFGDELTPEARAQEERQRARMAEKR
jgi:hypothetical protein